MINIRYKNKIYLLLSLPLLLSSIALSIIMTMALQELTIIPVKFCKPYRLQIAIESGTKVNLLKHLFEHSVINRNKHGFLSRKSTRES